MKKHPLAHFRTIPSVFSVVLSFGTPWILAAEPPADAVFVFNSCANLVESRLSLQHRSSDSFLAPAAPDRKTAEMRLRQGELIIEQITPSLDAVSSGAMLHHWRGSAFASGARADGFELLMRDIDSYPRHFSPQILQARLLTQSGDRLQAWMRLRQRHIVTVVMDTTCEITFSHLDAKHGYSVSHAAQIEEIGSPGTSGEHALTTSEEHGYLWRLNTYWSFDQRDGGLYVQIEVISLTRAIPLGLGWMIRPFVASVPRESLEFTLRSVRNALQNPPL